MNSIASGFSLWRVAHPFFDSESLQFADGLDHGIERRWKDGTSARGYPRFFLQGERATKRAYERRCQAEPSLTPWIASEDDPRRPFPSSLLR